MGTIKTTNIESISGSGTVTLGTSGETFNVPSGVTLSNSGTATGFGITMADQWRLTADLAAAASGNTAITANFEQVDDPGSGFIGSAMTESSGIFTFPSTGIYLISVVWDMSASGSALTDADVKIHTTVDNGTYDQTTANYSSCAAGSKLTGYSQHIFDVINVSNYKVKFMYYVNTAATLRGSSTQTETGFNFLRLGDT
jgi:hypothetical protein|tara:strand:+ start:481 stop:1077 length:597 start_codon:yes stop_codon:yes gene_type:complete